MATFLALLALVVSVQSFSHASDPAPPSDWAAAIAAGDMVWTPDLPFPFGWLTPGYYPVVGNGYLAKEPGPFVMPWENTWPWRDAGTVHIAGLNNGQGFGPVNDGPSHRAQVPSFVDPLIPQVPNASYINHGSAIDYRRATYFNRTAVKIPSQCEDAVVEIRHFAHRRYKHILVVEIEARKSSEKATWSPCTLALNWVTNDVSTVDLRFTAVPGPNNQSRAWFATNKHPEEPWLPLTELAVVSSLIPPNPTLFFPTPGTIYSMIVAFATNTSGDTPSAAADAWLQASALPSGELWEQHITAWDELWRAGGIEIMGNSSFAALINGSLYDILSSMRADWAWSSSPGGLGTNGYNGHTFWDMETWIFPVLAVLHPEMARNAVEYRIQRLNASKTRAVENGYSGAFWVWESGITGLDTAPWRQADLNENHISADIPLAWKKFYDATGDTAWLETAWDALYETCRFWECRFTRIDTNGSAPAPAGFGPNCSSKAGVGNFTVRNVICPDEGSGLVNDSAYTNAAAALTLSWCIEAAGILNKSIPASWQAMAQSPYLPLDSTLDPNGPVHQEYTGYIGWRAINQADVALLQYPLGMKFGENQSKRDLDYWSSVTNFDGMFTGDASYAAAYLALGERAAADNQLNAAWAHIEPHFNVFMETAIGTGTQHFITGSGGLLQNIVFGYAGLRIDRRGALSFASQRPLLPPLGITGVTLRGCHLFGTGFDFFYNDTAICVRLQSPAPTAVPLRVVIVSTAREFPLTVIETCFPNEAVEITVADGY